MSYYDNLDMNVKTIVERCREYYNPEDFVVIMNVDSKALTYTIQRPENVLIHQPSQVTKELYYTKDPDTIIVQPGQTRLVPAYEADHFIKQLTDIIVIRNRAKIIETGLNPTESAMDPAVQHKYIKQIFQGKRDFMNEYNQQLQAQESARALANKDLEDDPEPPKAVAAFQTPAATPITGA